MSKKFIRPSMPSFPKKELATNPVNDAYAKKVVGGAPVAFSAQASLKPDELVVLNAQTLQSGFRTPYFIDEIRISMVTSAFERDPAEIGAHLTGLSNAVSILFQTGSFMFSADSVPVGLMGPIFSPFDYGEAQINDQQARAFSTVRWALAKPLYMPAGDVVLASVKLNDVNGIFTEYFGADSPAVSVTVTYVGRLVPPGYTSTTRDVPWLAWFSKRASEDWKSSQTRFRNPFMIPAHVQRFVSRSYQVQYELETTLDNVLNELTTWAQITSFDIPYQEVRMDDSRGYFIVPRYTPVGLVFDATRKVWTFGRELTSREQFNMEIRNGRPYQGVPFPPLPANTDYITNIGLVGYRSETL